MIDISKGSNKNYWKGQPLYISVWALFKVKNQFLEQILYKALYDYFSKKNLGVFQSIF